MADTRCTRARGLSGRDLQQKSPRACRRMEHRGQSCALALSVLVALLSGITAAAASYGGGAGSTAAFVMAPSTTTRMFSGSSRSSSSSGRSSFGISDRVLGGVRGSVAAWGMSMLGSEQHHPMSAGTPAARRSGPVAPLSASSVHPNIYARPRRRMPSGPELELDRQQQQQHQARQHEQQQQQQQSSGSTDDSSSGSAERPFLPTLTVGDLRDLQSGERVQKQTRDGRSGTGVVCLDVRADKDTVMGLLSDFAAYTTMIDTVRETNMLGRRGDAERAEFMVSRFRLQIRVLMNRSKKNPDLINFSLDPEGAGGGKKAVLKEAEGFWFVESPTDRPDGYTRVWLSARVVTSSLLPGFVVDYAARRALPRASTWLQPACEAAQRRASLQKRLRKNVNAMTAASAVTQEQQQP